MSQLIILGVVLLAFGIILGHFFPNRYWIVLIAIGILLMIVGIVYLLLPSLLILPATIHYL